PLSGWSRRVSRRSGVVPGLAGGCRPRRRRVPYLHPAPPRTRSRAPAWGGGLSRLLLLHRLGDRQPTLLPDARRLAGEAPQEVELGAAHSPLADQLDLRDGRRVRREDALHADAGRDLAHREGRVDPGTPSSDAHALERLQPLLVALAHPHHHAHGVARIERGQVGPQAFPLDRSQSVHTLILVPEIAPKDRA